MVLCEIQGASPGRRVNGGLVLGELPYLEVEPMEDVVVVLQVQGDP